MGKHVGADLLDLWLIVDFQRWNYWRKLLKLVGSYGDLDDPGNQGFEAAC